MSPPSQNMAITPTAEGWGVIIQCPCMKACTCFGCQHWMWERRWQGRLHTALAQRGVMGGRKGGLGEACVLYPFCSKGS